MQVLKHKKEFLVLKERGVGFKPTESFFKTKFILPTEYHKLIYFQTI